MDAVDATNELPAKHRGQHPVRPRRPVGLPPCRHAASWRIVIGAGCRFHRCLLSTRSHDVTTNPLPAYQQLLETAYALGHTDGRLAAALDLPTAGLLSPTCRGRDPEDFARWLW